MQAVPIETWRRQTELSEPRRMGVVLQKPVELQCESGDSLLRVDDR